MKRTLFLWLLLPMLSWGQTPSCNFKGTFTGTAHGTAFANNTASPNCNAWALTWNSTGFTALSIQVEGSDDGSSYTAYSGTTTVLVGSNPSTSLSGATVIQASSKLAYVRVSVNSVSGTGGINYQVYGYNGVSNGAKGASGGGSTSWASITPGTNNKGFMQVQSPTVIEPTAISGGGIYATQMVDANDLPALTITTPGGPAIDYANIATSTGGAGATVTIQPTGADGNVILSLVSKGTANLLLNGCSITSTGALSCPGTITSGSGSGAAGGVDLTAGTALSTVANSVTLTVPTSVTPYLFQYPGAAPSATSVLAMSTAGVGSFYSLTTTDAATKVASYSGSPPVDGNCAFWLNGDLRDFGSNCSSGPVFPVNPQTTTYAVTAADFAACKNITVASGTFTVTLVAGGGTQPGNGKCIWVTNYGSGTVTIARNGQNINGAAADLTLNGATSSAPSYAFIVSDAVNYFAAVTNPASGSSLPSGTGAVAVHSSTGVLATPHDMAIPMKCAAASASTTTYTCATSPTFTPATNDVVWFCADIANTASSTLNVNAAGAATIKKQQGTANLAANDLQAGGCAPMEFDGTNWQMLGQTGNAGGGGGAVSSVGGLTGAVPGGRILLGVYTASGLTELDVVTRTSSGQSGAIFQSDYDQYEIEIKSIVPSVSGTALAFNVSTNGGSTYDTGNNYTWGSQRWSSTGTALAGTSGASPSVGYFDFACDGVLANTKPSVITLLIYDPASASAVKRAAWNSNAYDGTSAPNVTCLGSGTYESTTAINAFRIFAGTHGAVNTRNGNITATIRVYGLAEQ